MRTLAPQDRKELREFGLGLALLIMLIFWGLLPWLGDRPRPTWPLAASALLVWPHWPGRSRSIPSTAFCCP